MWEKTLEWSRLKGAVWKKVATELGAEDVNDKLTIANVANEDDQAEWGELKLKGIDGILVPWVETRS